MPEIPDLTVYLEALQSRCVGATLERVRLGSPFLLRSVEPPLSAACGRRVTGLRRLGKRIVIELEAGQGTAETEPLFLVIHLMIAGRFKWSASSRRAGASARLGGRVALAAFDFSTGTLLLNEASTRKRASLHLALGESALAALDPGGREPMGMSRADFAEIIRSENHTIKRTLTDPRLFAGIGNAYSDEILHHARLSPVRLTKRLTDEEVFRLHASVQLVLEDWIARLRSSAGSAFPEKVTAFRPEMAVHGRFGMPCPTCGAKVQRIAHGESEINYCAICQNGGRLLADRALSRLLGKDWPKTLDEMEQRKDRLRESPGGGPSATIHLPDDEPEIA